jgi:Zn-dependent peptidase ImmA (M78 family)
VRPLRPRYARITRLVKQILLSADASKAPIDVEEIARSKGVSIHFEKFDADVSGVLVREASGSVIGVQRMHPRTRQRFTIAHELGHLMLHEGDTVHVDRAFRVNFRKESLDEPRDVEETEANAFAAQLLMPQELIEKVIQSRTLDLEDATEIERLARIFFVSTQAMNIRLIQLYSR